MAKEPKITVRKTASSKQTGGGGFVFEDKVAAWFIAHFLSDSPIFGTNIGAIKRIEFQVRPEGWLFDDLLLTLENNVRQCTKVAVSVKSNIQFNSNGPSEELLNDIWNQYLKTIPSPFDPAKDFLCIVNSGLPVSISGDLNVLLRAAKSQDAATFFDRITNKSHGFSLTQQKLFKDFCCPKVLADEHKVEEQLTVEVLKKLLLIEFDFEKTVSKDVIEITNLCRSCLANPIDADAERLYEKLYSFRAEFAPTSGYLDYNKLILKLRNHFDLKGYANHIGDWRKISEVSISKISAIPDKIGNQVNLSRSRELNQIENLVHDNRAVFILGQSGYGKSVIAKKYIEEKLSDKDLFMWIDSQAMEHHNLATYFDVQHSMVDLFKNVQQPNCYLFIDGIDRFFQDAQLSLLFDVFTVAMIPESPWKIIITSQTDDYNDVIERLYRINITLNAVDYRVNLNVYEQLLDIKAHFPELSNLFKHTHLRPVLNNLKYLDLLAFNLTASTVSDTDFVGESTIIDWIWKEEIESKGSQSSRFVQVFSEKQAENLSFSIPTSDFDIAELQPLDGLKTGKIFIDIDDRLFLTHDLFGDWARYKLIRANKDKLKQFLLSKELFSPLWCKAIRLYGIYLLEKNGDASDWITFFKSLDSQESKEKIIQDLLLESIIFSTSTFSYLTTVWVFLQENKGALLKRFLDQFMIKATIPNQAVLQIAKDLGGYSVAEASTYNRLPNIVYWPGVVKFLYLQRKEIIQLSREKLASLGLMWLQNTTTDFPLRKMISEIALENANAIFELKLNTGGYLPGDDDKEIYKAFLAGVNEFPEEVLTLALKLCRRINIDDLKKVNEKVIGYDMHGISISKMAKIRDAEQWPNGPYEDPDDAFEEICFNDQALNPVILAYPEKAKEILLALFIESPREVSFGFDHNYHYDIKEPLRWFPPLYTKGPFLYFLNHQPAEGLDFIVKLINFATEQWTSDYVYKEKSIPKVTIDFSDTQRNYIGNHKMYFWFRDVGNASHSLVSALQALEKFFIDRMDGGKPVSDYIDLILKKGNSVAYLGVLNSLGKYEPELYLQNLKPLLQCLNFYEWDKSLYNVEGHQMMGSNFLGKTNWELAKNWHTMPHRKRSIQDIAIHLYINNQEIQDYFKGITIAWEQILKEVEASGAFHAQLTNLVAYFNIDNYEQKKEGDRVNYYYKEPKAVSEKFELLRAESKEDFDIQIFPFKCMQDIEKEIVYTEEECNTVWDNIQKMSQANDPEPYSSFSGQYQCVLGGCAVLLYNKDKWFTKNPERLQWILEYTKNALIEYKPNSYSSSEADLGDSWTAFTARILAVLWSDDTQNKTLRKLIGLLIIKSSYESTNVLFSTISKKIKWSDKNFIQVQNFLILWSLYLDEHYDKSSHKSFYFEEAEELSFLNKILDRIGLGKLKKTKPKEFDIEKVKEKLLRDFINNKISHELVDWSKLRLKKAKKGRGHWRNDFDRTIGNEPGLDKKMFQHAFISLPQFDTVPGDEQKHLIKFWMQVIEQMTFELGVITEHSRPHDQYPHQFDIWALERISQLVLQLNAEAAIKPEDLWKPILQYGHLANKWIDIFFSYFYTHHSDKKEIYDKFFTVLREMILYADSCASWQITSCNREREIWAAVMGLSETELRWWKNENITDFYKRLVLEDIKWAQKRAYDPNTIYKILYILQTVPGEIVIKEGIAIITKYLNFRKESDKIETPEGYVKVAFKHEDFLAKAISYLWENYRDKIKNDPSSLHGFKEIVMYLVGMQNPIGLELQRNLI